MQTIRATDTPVTSPKAPGDSDFRLGRRIALLRRSADMSQTTLGSHLGVTFQQVQKYEKGRNRIPVSRLVTIARLFGVSLAALHGVEEGEGTSELMDILDIPGAGAILRSYAKITDPVVREAALRAVQGMSIPKRTEA